LAVAAGAARQFVTPVSVCGGVMMVLLGKSEKTLISTMYFY
jgi:hypothetical protein